MRRPFPLLLVAALVAAAAACSSSDDPARMLDRVSQAQATTLCLDLSAINTDNSSSEDQSRRYAALVVDARSIGAMDFADRAERLGELSAAFKAQIDRGLDPATSAAEVAQARKDLARLVAVLSELNLACAERGVVPTTRSR